MPPSLGPLLVVLGLVIAAVGALVWTGALGWLGKLPGDLRWEKDGVSVFVPVTTMLLLSALVSLALWIAGKLRGGG